MRQKMMIVALVLITLTGCYQKVESVATTSPSFDEVFTSRRSVRNYDASKKISEAEVRELIKAAQDAPSWANQQPTKYYVAISNEKLAAVQDIQGMRLLWLSSLLAIGQKSRSARTGGIWMRS